MKVNKQKYFKISRIIGLGKKVNKRQKRDDICFGQNVLDTLLNNIYIHTYYLIFIRLLSIYTFLCTLHAEKYVILFFFSFFFLYFKF